MPTPPSKPVSPKSRKIPKSTKFEDALGELEAIVESLENGEQSLEVSLEQFERGVTLSRFCQQSLSEAEQKVKILMDDTAAATSDADEDDGLEEFELGESD
jgi:exodeoxyribonuclease VII small subunit